MPLGFGGLGALLCAPSVWTASPTPGLVPAGPPGPLPQGRIIINDELNKLPKMPMGDTASVCSAMSAMSKHSGTPRLHGHPRLLRSASWPLWRGVAGGV